MLSAVSTKPPNLLPPEIPIEEETLDGYDPEHYYPVEIQEVLNDTYQVTNKLGFGRSSTVWLARNIRRWGWQDDQYVALKVFTSNLEFQAAAKHEAEISKRIMAANPEHPGFYHIRKVFDSFNINGPNNTHTCLVCEPMRETLYLFQKRFPGGIINSMTLKYMLQFLLSGLDYLHSECKVVHTDIKAWNILMSVEDSTVLEKAAKAEEREPCPRKVVGERTIYRSLLSLADFGSGRGLPRLADLGNAAVGDLDLPLKHPIQPNAYRAPEVSIGAEWSYSADIWNLGVMIWDLLEGKALCDGLHPGCNDYTTHAHLGQLIALLGPPPDLLLARGEETSLHFSSDGRFESPELIPHNYTLENSITQLAGEEKRLFLEFARRMLCWLPEDRASCKELLDDPWLRYGL